MLQLSKSYDINALKNTFDPSRIEEENTILETWMACATCGMPPHDIVSFSIPEVVPEPPPSLHSKWKGVWGKCQEVLGRYLGKKEKEEGRGAVGSLLGFVYWKIGWDCGKALRGLHKGGISWGTYTDTLGYHSNGHVNNMVVLPPPLSLPSTNHLLCPLDYDMAYLCETFEGDGGGVEENLAVEVNSMRMSLSGGDLNTGVRGTEGWEGDWRVAIWGAALLDTALSGFDCSFEGKEDVHRVGGDEKELMEAAVAVTQLALILSL